MADKRRKLYNGMIPCQLYMYFKEEQKKAQNLPEQNHILTEGITAS